MKIYRIIGLLEPIQYHTAFTVTGAFRKNSKESLYQELGFESSQSSKMVSEIISL